MAPERPTARRLRLGLTTFVGFAGLRHFANPRFFDDIVPPWARRVARDASAIDVVAPSGAPR